MSFNGKSLILIGALATMMAVYSCSKKEDTSQQTDQQLQKATDIADASDSLVLTMDGVDSMSVFDVLQKHHTVRFMTSLRGAYVTRIDDTPNREGYFWVYSVNGVMGQTACDKYITKKGDKVEWHYRMKGQMQF